MPIGPTTGGHVNEFNDLDVIYIRGDAVTDGSLRYSVTPRGNTDITEIQRRRNGVWQPTSFKTGADSVAVGTLVALSAAGDNLITTDADNHIHFHARSSFENGVTNGLANIVNALAFFERVVFRSDESGEFTGQVISTVDLNITAHLLTSKFYFKTGAAAATAPVRIQSWEGTDDTGLLIFDQTYEQELFPANTEIALTLEGFLEFHIGDNTFTKISSDNDFSLKTDATVTVWWLAVDFSSIKDDDLLQTTEWVSGDTFTKGDWSTRNRKVYEANETGIQSGTFDDNSDKWDQIISVQGFDRILTTLSGEAVPDNIGNLVISN